MNNLLLKEYIKSIILNENYSFYGKDINKILQDLNRISASQENDEEFAEEADQYLVQITKKLGEGSFRRVYDLDDDFVLKIALVEEGKNANLSEKEAYKVLKEYSPKIYIHGKDYRYILAEKCEVASSSEDEEYWMLKCMNYDEELYNKLNNFIYEYIKDGEVVGEGMNDLCRLFIMYIIGISIENNFLSKFNYRTMSDEDNKNLLLLDFSKKIIHAYNDGYHGPITDAKMDNIGFGSDERPVFVDMGSF
jgi:hypothetical protein